MQFRHDMPFGARLLDGGGTDFRLWAPAAERVELELEGNLLLPMEARTDGWFTLQCTQAGRASRYRFRIDGTHGVPDPASRYQPDGPNGPSEVIDPLAWQWRTPHWNGRPEHELVISEVHVGTLCPEGDFDGLRRRLDHFAALGITAIELMPVAETPGKWNWGYDMVLPFAPSSRYGSPAALKQLVDEAHERELSVILDVVYNHFGPEGNHLPRYAPRFFSTRHHTPWGAAINFDGPDSETIRSFFIHNALYWLQEYRIDGLRLDAVHTIMDDSRRDILTELAERIRRGPGRERHIQLVLENDANEARYLRRNPTGKATLYNAQWNDDFHHCLHVLLTGESHGYYGDYVDHPTDHLARTLTEGFAWQGEPSAFRGARIRGEPSADLPPLAFVAFLQNHDQTGNRAAGERITALAPARAVRMATALLLLAPFPPLLFMGQEWGCEQPFPFFCDFRPELADAVREGRREEFPDHEASRIPDPCAGSTFRSAVLDWSAPDTPAGNRWLTFHRRLLALRRLHVLPLLPGLKADAASMYRRGRTGIATTWRGERGQLSLLLNAGSESTSGFMRPPGQCLMALPLLPEGDESLTLPPWSIAWYKDS